VLAVCLLCHTAATTQGAATIQGQESWSLCQARAAFVAGARLRGTVGGAAKRHTGSSTSQCARCCKLPHCSTVSGLAARAYCQCSAHSHAFSGFVWSCLLMGGDPLWQPTHLSSSCQGFLLSGCCDWGLRVADLTSWALSHVSNWQLAAPVCFKLWATAMICRCCCACEQQAIVFIVSGKGCICGGCKVAR
jgi:hypothetical protein